MRVNEKWLRLRTQGRERPNSIVDSMTVVDL
jgi:hypothetical protein